ncbi:MAG: LOG family protein [Planctomycetes bacterium]|nr:LOG family protein [Planctomycetota bacterium]
MRKPILGVMGGGSNRPAVDAEARQLGALIAERGWILLNGGGDGGVMAASARGAKEHGGTVIGILRGKTTRGASPDLDIAILTGMGDARNVINVLTSDVVIACPGRAGTMSEVALALNSGKRVILLGWDAGDGLARFQRKGQLTRANSANEAVEQAAAVIADLHEG